MRETLFAFATLLLAGSTASLSGAALTIVENGVARAPVILAENSPEASRVAARELAGYIEKISGAKPELLEGRPVPLPESAVWVGYQPVLGEIFPGMDFDFEHPEEILLAANEKHVVIAGRDVMAGEKQIEHGTANAVYEFIEKKLDVRWLWPFSLGEDIVQRETIAFAPFEHRFHPPFLTRHLYPQQPPEWHRRQRVSLYSQPFFAGHAFTDWWERYGESNPEYFALRPDGTRRPGRDPREIKLCVSNPAVAEQWLENAEEVLANNPGQTMISGSPNDGPGFCMCENCRAWDHPDAPTGVLTDRYVRFWNILARGLKERFPDREVYLGAMAYSAYSEPPIAETPEDNIVIFHVGHFPLTTEESRQAQKAHWRAWAGMAARMVYRPNYWYWSGGVWGMPEVALSKTIEDFRFLAENRCTGIIVDVMRHHWANHGPQYYLIAQLTYNPMQDAQALLDDYYRRAFGPAAGELERYWNLMEEARDTVVDAPDFKLGSGNRFNTIRILARTYDDEFLAKADAILARAKEETAAAPEVYKRRVEFVRTGLEHTRLMMSAVPVMARVRESAGQDLAAVKEAQDIWDRIERNARESEPWAVSWGGVHAIMRGGYMGRVQEYFGPPTEEMLRPIVNLAPASWTPAWSDEFDRHELGDGWRVLSGNWSIEDGRLVSSGGGRILVAKRLPGLQRVEFEASIEPDADGIVSDLSPVIHARDDGAGYLLQFGGYHNTRNSVQKMGSVLVENDEKAIQPGKTHSIVAELDGNRLRLIVDGDTVVEQSDYQPLVKPGHEHVGLYVYRGNVKIDRVKVYTSEAVGRGHEADPDVRFAQ